MLERWRAYRAESQRRRTWERLQDERYELSKWGFAKTTSEKARARRRIAALEERIEELGLPDEDWLERGGHHA